MDRLDEDVRNGTKPDRPDLTSERWIKRSLFIATGISAVAIFFILALLVYLCMPLLTSGGIKTVLSWNWKPFNGEYGILPMCLTSLFLSIFASGLAIPVAIGICSFIAVLGPRTLARLLQALVHFMTSIPTVIYGFVSVFLLVPLVRDYLKMGTGFSFITAGLTLTLLILPTIVLLFHARLQQIDPVLLLSAEAMGLTRAQQFFYVLIPASSRGLVTGAVLGFARAMGDTLISLMLAGNAPQVPSSFFDSVRTLTAHIALVVATDSQSMSYRSVFASGLLLFLMMGGINFLIRKLDSRIESERFNEKGA